MDYIVVTDQKPFKEPQYHDFYTPRGYKNNSNKLMMIKSDRNENIFIKRKWKVQKNRLQYIEKLE